MLQCYLTMLFNLLNHNFWLACALQACLLNSSCPGALVHAIQYLFTARHDNAKSHRPHHPPLPCPTEPPSGWYSWSPRRSCLCRPIPRCPGSAWACAHSLVDGIGCLACWVPWQPWWSADPDCFSRLEFFRSIVWRYTAVAQLCCRWQTKAKVTVWPYLTSSRNSGFLSSSVPLSVLYSRCSRATGKNRQSWPSNTSLAKSNRLSIRFLKKGNIVSKQAITVKKRRGKKVDTLDRNIPCNTNFRSRKLACKYHDEPYLL